MHIVSVPFLGVNDTEGKLLCWHYPEGQFVRAGETIAEIETTKIVIEITAETSGHLYPIVQVDSTVVSSQPIGFLSENPVCDPAKEFASITALESVDENSAPTKKAEILISRFGLDLEDVISYSKGGKITESTVNEYLQLKNAQDFRRGIVNRERVGIVGGVAGGGALLIIDSLIRNVHQQAVCIFDRDASFHGKEILGVPVVGSIDCIDEWMAKGRLDSAVIAFNRNLDERKKVFLELREKKIPMCNVIDRTAEIRSMVEIGAGNVILSRAYIGACSSIGDNNFISANVCLEHGNILGSHCAFGPGVFTSGNVVIGDRVRFATGIFVEPNVQIGDGAIIASGAAVTSNILDGGVLKSRRRI